MISGSIVGSKLCSIDEVSRDVELWPIFNLNFFDDKTSKNSLEVNVVQMKCGDQSYKHNSKVSSRYIHKYSL